MRETLTVILQFRQDRQDAVQCNVVGSDQLPKAVLLERLPFQARVWKQVTIRGGIVKRTVQLLNAIPHMRFDDSRSTPAQPLFTTAMQST